MSTDVILATSVGMDESVSDNGAAFKYLITEAVAYNKVAVINGRFNIQTPQVFTGIGRFTIRSSTPNKIDQGFGPELNYIGLNTNQPLFKFIGCQANSKWGVDLYGVTINLNGGCKYGINMHTSSASGEHNFTNSNWIYNNVFINSVMDGGAGWRLTGDINNDTHIWNACGGYPGNNAGSVKTLTLGTDNNQFNPNIYNDVPLVQQNYQSRRPIRARITVDNTSYITSIVVTDGSHGYTTGTVLIPDIRYYGIDSFVTQHYSSGSDVYFTVASVGSGKYSELNNSSYSGTSGNSSRPRVTVDDYNNFVPYTFGTAQPTSGLYYSGDTVLNWTEVDGYGATQGWVCTSGDGTGVGTWTTLSNGVGTYGLGDPTKGAALIEVDNPNSVGLVIRECQLNVGSQGIRNMRGGVRVYDCNFSNNSDVDIYTNMGNVVVEGGWTEQSNRFMAEPYSRVDSGIFVSNMRLASYPYGYSMLNKVYMDNGTSSGGSSTTLSDSTKNWTTNQFAGQTVYIRSGTNAGIARKIISNSATTLNVSAWPTTITNTSVYEIYQATDIKSFATIMSSRFSGVTIINCQLNTTDLTYLPMHLMVLYNSNEKPYNYTNIGSTARKAGEWKTPFVENYVRDSAVFKWSSLYEVAKSKT